jgi:hypothetical protein
MSNDYSNINLTELVALAHEAGHLNAHHGVGRSGLVDLLEGRSSDIELDPVDEEREAMLDLQAKWPDVLNQLPCSSDHYACWVCPAGRVIHCFLNWEPDVWQYRENIRKGIGRAKK